MSLRRDIILGTTDHRGLNPWHCQRTDGVDRVFSTSMDWLHAEKPSGDTLVYSVETLLFDIGSFLVRR